MSEQNSILIIDDDVQLVETVKTLLESVGYRVSHAYQAQKGLRLAKEIRPDLILLDVMFAEPPGPDGIELSRKLCHDVELGDVPIIILSGVRKVLGYPFELSPDETWMPVKAFIEKPFEPADLLREVDRVLGPKC